MGFSSQAGQVLFRTQSAQGTLAADLGTAGIAMKLRSGALGTNRELMIPDPEIGGGRDVADAYMGTINNSGDYEFYARLESLTTLIKAAFGDAASVTTTGVTTHTFTPSDAAELPYLSIEERIAAGFETFNFTDGVVNTLHLEAEANGYLMGTAGVIAARRVAGATPTVAPNWDDSPMIVGTNIFVTYNSITLPAKSFSFDINNNFEDDDFRLGSFFVGDLTPKRREVTAGFSIREKDKDLWRQSTLGSSSSVVPIGVPVKDELVITCTTYEDILAGTPLTKASISITIPKFVIKPYDISVSGDDILESSIEGQALRPVQADDICTVVVTNGAPAIA
jgi:tail tube protein